MIEWAKSHSKFKYCSRMSQFASRRDNLKVLKYLYKDGCIFNCMVLAEAIDNENIKIINWFLKKSKSKKINKSTFDIIKGSDLCFHKACEKGNFNIIKILKENDIHGDYDSESCSSAVFGNNLKLLKYLINEGYRFSKDSYVEAARNGNINILKYLFDIAQHDLSYPWFDKTATAEAAKYGKLKTLKWLVKKGCIWDVFTTFLASKYNHIETLKWSLENGCPIYEGLYENIYKFHSLVIEKNKCNIVN